MSFGSGSEVKPVASVNQRRTSGQRAKWKVRSPFKMVSLSLKELRVRMGAKLLIQEEAGSLGGIYIFFNCQ